MAKDPAFLFYPSDFLTGTMFMNNEQIGIYIRLLCSQHQHGGIIDKLSFNSLVLGNDLLKSKFIETESGFYNERLADEMTKRNRKSSNMSDTAKRVWEERKNTKVKENDTNALQMHNKSNTKVSKKDTFAMHSVNVNENRNINKIEVKDGVKVTEDENEKLKEYFQAFYDDALTILSNYKLSSGKKYKSDYHALIGWVAKSIKKENNGKLTRIDKIATAYTDIPD